MPAGRPFESYETRYNRAVKLIKHLKEVELPKYRDEFERFIAKKPHYYHSFSGFDIFRTWYRQNGFRPDEAKMLVVMSHYTYMTVSDLCFWNIRVKKLKSLFRILASRGYMEEVKIPGWRNRPKLAFCLTQKGRDLEADYERFYDLRYAEFMEKKMKPVLFDKTQYFRRKRLTKTEIRERGGNVRSSIDRWIDPN